MLIDVQEWSMPDTVRGPLKWILATDRCYHLRPKNGNPCAECPCPGPPQQTGPRIEHGTHITAWWGCDTWSAYVHARCNRCHAVFKGTPYPYLIDRPGSHNP